VWNWLKLMVLMSVAALANADAAGGDTARPVVIERGVAQLFVDDFLIASEQGLKRTLHQPRKEHGGRQPVIAVPDEGTLLAKGTILKDPRLGRHVMFAKGFRTKQMYRFVSRDGLDWEPDRRGGQVVPVEMDRRNPATGKVEGYGGMHSFHYDNDDEAHPYKGWVFFGNWGNEHEGVYYIRSADGITWERRGLVVQGYAGPGDTSCRVIHQDGKTVYGPGDVTRYYHDERDDRFLGIFKFFTVDRVPPDNGLRSRAYAFLERIDRPFDISRLDHVALLPPAARKNGDGPHDEYYSSSAWRYESLWLGGLLVWHRGEDYPFSAAGCAFLKLVVSRDGLHWNKVQFPNDAGVPEVFIPNGPEGGNDGRNDGGYMSEFSQGPLRIGDELIYYYGCSSYGKDHPSGKRNSGGGIFRARLRLDGFVSVDAGTLTTRPLRFGGSELYLNSRGPVRVEALDSGGEVLGRSEVDRDALRGRVTFDGRSLRETAPERTVRLRFSVGPDAELYAFRIECRRGIGAWIGRSDGRAPSSPNPGKRAKVKQLRYLHVSNSAHHHAKKQ